MIKRFIENMKDPITDLVGLFIMVLTLIERYHDHVQWIWEGIAGISVGTALFLMPDQWIKDALDHVIKKITDKNNNS